MSQKIVLGLLLSLTSISHADLKDKIESLKQTVQGAGNPPPCEICSLTSAGKPQDTASLMKSCVESICSSKEFSLEAIYDKMTDRASKPDPQYEKEIAPLVKALSVEDAKTGVEGSQSHLEWLKTAKEISHPGAIKFLNFIRSLSNFTNFQFKEENGKTVVDLGKSKAKFPGMNETDFRKEAQVAAIIYKAYTMDKALPESDPAKLKLRYSDAQLKEKISQIISSFDERRKKIIGNPEFDFLNGLSEFNSVMSGQRIEARLASAEQITPVLIDEINSLNSLSNLYLAISEDSEFRKLMTTPPVDIQMMAKKINAEKDYRAKLESRQAILNGKKKIDSQKCRATFALAQQMLPTKQDIEDFKLRASSIKEKFHNQTQRLVCSSETEKYNKAFQSWTPNFPVTKEQHVKNMKVSFQQALEISRRAKTIRKEVDRSPYKDIYYALGISALREESPTEDADNLCDTLKPNPLPDAATYFNKEFLAGPIVIEHKHAEGICHHELGHKLYGYMRYNSSCNDEKFLQMRSCLMANHTEFTPQEQIQQLGLKMQGAETKYEAEDWADMISVLVDDKASNYACLWSKKLKPQDYKNLSLRNQLESDTHSSPLFRLLHIEYLKNGKIPERCQQALASKGEKAYFNNCLDR